MKKLIFVPLFILLSSCEVAPLLSTSFSKDYCSCRFISGGEDEYCFQVSEQIISVKSYQVDLEKKQVRSRGLGHFALARFDEERGCYIADKG